LTDEYGKYLVSQKLSPVTIKNYLADTSQFLSWLGQNNQQSRPKDDRPLAETISN